MVASEINLEKDGFRFNTRTHPARSHYKFLMDLGRVLPETKAQIKHFVSSSISLDVLNADDVEVVEEILVKYGFTGKYKYTKSKGWVRLQNYEDLIKAFKLKLKELS